MHRDEEGLIMPKKLINPCLESKERKNLHRELLFNQKIGKNVLNQKSELQKALQERRLKGFTEERETKESTNLEMELEKIIAKRRNLAENNGSNNSTTRDNESELNEEYLRIRSGLRHKQNNDI